MKVGFAQIKITPSLERPVFLAGFGNNRRAASIHDDLYARAVCIAQGETTLVLCALDLIGLFRPDVQEVIQGLEGKEIYQRLKPEVLIASTHTHHGPDTMGLWGPDHKVRGVDAAYMRMLKDKIAGVITAALSDLKAAEVKSAAIHAPGLAKNARNPEIVDDELTVIQFVAPGGGPLVTLLDFPCHPEVLWEHNPHITRDYPGFLLEEVEKQTGAPAIFFSGSLGGMMTPDVQEHSFGEAEAMGKALAQAGLSALAGAEAQADARLSLKKKTIRARLTNILYKLAFSRKLLPDVRDRSGNITSEVNIIQIGEVWMATVPGELLPRLGLEVKAELKWAGAREAAVIGLANDELGYILPPEDFKYPWNPFNPGKHYEETNSIGKEIGLRVMEGLRALL